MENTMKFRKGFALSEKTQAPLK